MNTVLTKTQLKKLGTSTDEILNLLKSNAFVQMQKYKAKIMPFEKKYGMPFSQFKQKLEVAQEENFQEADDFILWEGFYEAYELWYKKYIALQQYA